MIPSSPAWVEHALCAQVGDPEMWFPNDSEWTRARQARAICHTCPVQDECLTYAVRSGQQYGVWGGYGAHELAAIRDGRDPAQARQPNPGRLRRRDLLARHGITARQVRTWAIGRGIPVQAAGVPAADLIEAYLQEHNA